MTASAFLLAAALFLQEEEEPATPTLIINEGGDYGWGCSTGVAIGRFRGGVWRDYDRKRRRSPYVMQLRLADPDPRHTIGWTIDPELGAPDKEGRPTLSARGAAAFGKGPRTVLVDFKWAPRPMVGPLRVWFWGDGVYAGSRTAMSARRVRRYYGGEDGSSGSARADRSLVARLVSARTWTAVLTDGAGNRLASETFQMPTPREAEAAFRAGRARIDAVEPRFRADHDPLELDGVQCIDQLNPIADI